MARASTKRAFREEADPAQDREREVMRLREQRMRAIVGRLDALAQDQVSRKQIIEERCIEDLRAYHGRYDFKTESNLRLLKKSRLYVGLSRQKTHAWEARISDMLFPTDEKNWGIKPTPVPTLTASAREAVRKAVELVDEANALQERGDVEGGQAKAAEANEWAVKARELHNTMAEAKRRSELMERVIEDQLVEARYSVSCRDQIHDACKLGTGIIKGPMVAHRRRGHWQKDPNSGLWVHAMVDDPRPDYLYVDFWGFYPDMSARNIDEAEFTFERHLPNKVTFKQMAKRVGFIPEAAARVLAETPRMPAPDWMGRLREITGLSDGLDGDRYHVWEYHGPLEKKEMLDLADIAGDTQMVEQIENSPLEEYRVILWFCEGELLKIGEHPLDSGESLYSVFNFEKDASSIFGFGVPHLMSGSQAALNGAWRMMMDNAAISAGPQVVIDATQVEPQDGDWTLRAHKIWKRTKEATQGTAQQKVFEVHEITNNQQQLAGIIELARQFADDETNMPLIAQGESASHVTTTMGGMSMLMNSANVVFRRIVRSYDDDQTTRTIRRAYDWNMQFHPDDAIKGDMQIDARGSSVLLVRELQGNNLMQITERWSVHPIIGRYIKVADACRKTLQAFMISPDDVIKDDDTILREDIEAAKNPQKSPDEIRMEIAAMEMKSRETVAKLNYDAAMIQLAEQRNMKLDELRALIEDKAAERKSKERQLAAEMGFDARQAREARAAGQTPNGSGGAVSS